MIAPVVNEIEVSLITSVFWLLDIICHFQFSGFGSTDSYATDAHSCTSLSSSANRTIRSYRNPIFSSSRFERVLSSLTNEFGIIDRERPNTQTFSF
jgi:hypothetical protein